MGTEILRFMLLISLLIIRDWYSYKLRGRVSPDDPEDENPPVITGPGDAHAQRLIDLYKQDHQTRQNKQDSQDPPGEPKP